MKSKTETRRRDLLLAMAGLLPLGCATREGARGVSEARLDPSQARVRPAASGQRWTYRVTNLYNGETVDEFAESVLVVGTQFHVRRDAPGDLPHPDEVHEPWGMLRSDPHWSPPIAFAQPLPAWPPQLAAGRVEQYGTYYHTLASPDFPLWWSQQMRSVGWEEMTVPAGTFIVLRFDNQISFESSEFWRNDSTREESVWLCPQIGRWVQRRSHGRYFLPGPSGGEMFEDYRQEQLLAWQ